ncbi:MULTISPECIES: hypothetical protein [Mycobacteriaceae]|uniref:hypothetical protein n=1 Tax=Mycobacteriaceae TaxID=1762 RepID=UPI0008019113|nr:MULTISPECIES: hypothetical protein [Mycobacteriaceae]MCK0176139.1 hypothetical protein [Mycolicibacterium sp. F2034L]OBB58281.1 hypothetical protein A5757_17485 [Mycobacterium sp. 852013-51886_SCH5428379]
MKIRVMPYVTVEIDDRLRQRARRMGEQLRVTLRAYLLSAADDVDAAGDRVRDMCDAAVNRVDTVVASVNDKIAPTAPAEPAGPVRLKAV